MRGMIGMMGVALLASAVLGSAAPQSAGTVACLQGDDGARAVVVTTARSGRMTARAPGQRARALRAQAAKLTGARRVSLVRRAKSLEARQKALDARCARLEAPGGIPSSASPDADEPSDIVGLGDLLSLTDGPLSEPARDAAPALPWVCDPRITTACLPTPECYFAMYDNDPDAEAICRRLPGEEPSPPDDATPQP